MTASPTGRQHSNGSVWYVIVLLTVVNAFSYMDRMALSVLAPLIKADLELTDAQLGLLTGLAFSVFYAICGIPIARWADRGSRSALISVALSAWSVMTALSGAAQSFWHLCLARMGLGAGEAGCVPAAQSLICDYVPPRRRAAVFAVHNFGNCAGVMLGMVLAGWLGESIGWRWTFVALGAPGLGLALLVKLTLREPVRGGQDAHPGGSEEEKGRTFLKTLAVLWHCRTYKLLAAMYVLNGCIQYGLNQWWPSFYTRIGGFSIASVGIYLGLAIGVGAAGGSLIGGALSSMAARRDVRLPLILGAVATVLAMPFALGTLFAPSLAVAMLLVALTSVLWTISHGPVIAAVTSVVSPQMRATAASLTIFGASMFGFGLGPFFVGLLSDLLHPSFGVQALRYAMLLPVGLIPVMALAVYGAAKALPRDLK